MDDTMQNQMMTRESMQSMRMKQMQKHQVIIYTFDVLMLVGFAAVIVMLSKILKQLRKK